MRNLLYVHGPGLNTEPNRRALAAQLERAGFVAEFWNEPSELRPDGAPFRPEAAYSACLHDLRERLEAAPEPVTIVASSLAAFLVSQLAGDPDVRPRIRNAVFEGAVFDLVALHRSMLAFCRDDLAGPAPEKASRLGELLELAKEPYDSFFQEGLAIALGNPRLLEHYFPDATARESWVAVMSEPRWEIDATAMDAYFREFRSAGRLPRHSLGLPCRCVFGSEDPVTSPDAARPALDQLYPGWRCDLFPEVGHWPSLERPEAFVEILAADA